jgi:hypothetical protein
MTRLGKKERALSRPPDSFTLGLWLEVLGVSGDEFAERLGVGRPTGNGRLATVNRART